MRRPEWDVPSTLYHITARLSWGDLKMLAERRMFDVRRASNLRRTRVRVKLVWSKLELNFLFGWPNPVPKTVKVRKE